MPGLFVFLRRVGLRCVSLNPSPRISDYMENGLERYMSLFRRKVRYDKLVPNLRICSAQRYLLPRRLVLGLWRGC